MRHKTHYCLQRADNSDTAAKLYIYDDVTEYPTLNWNTWQYEDSETSAKYFRDAMADLPDGQPVELHINSNGGSVKEGVAIYNLLKQSGRQLTGIVDGVAHSVAFLILQACDHRIMELGTTALVHNMWLSCEGNSKQLRKYADDLDDMMEANRKIFLERATITEEQLVEIMEAETYLTPDKALEYGLIDEIGSTEARTPDTGAMLEQMQALRQMLTSDRSFREQLQALHDSIPAAAAKTPAEDAQEATPAEPETPAPTLLTLFNHIH